MRMPLVALLGLAVVVACTTPTPVCGCSPRETARALVVGTLAAAGDIGLRGTLIIARSTRGSGPARSTAVDIGYTTPTDSTGRYRVYVAPGSAAGHTVCVQTVAYRSASARMDTLVSSKATLQIVIFERARAAGAIVLGKDSDFVDRVTRDRPPQCSTEHFRSLGGSATPST